MVSGLKLSALKDTMEVMVDEVSLSISKGGATRPNVGLSGSSMGKEGVIPFAS